MIVNRWYPPKNKNVFVSIVLTEFTKESEMETQKEQAQNKPIKTKEQILQDKAQALRNVDELIKLHDEYVSLLHKLKIGLDQHFERELKKEQKGGAK